MAIQTLTKEFPTGTPGGTTVAIAGKVVSTSAGVIPLVASATVPVPAPPPPVPAPTPPRRDPLAQTFKVKGSLFLKGVELWFSATPAGASIENVSVRVFEVENGIPTNRQVGGTRAVATKTAAEVLVNVNAGEVTLFRFPEPVYLQGDQAYAIHVKTTSAEYFIYSAKLGELRVGETSDAARYRSVLGDAASQGSLAVSSDDRTWAAVPNSDLYFRLEVAKFTNSKTIEFLPVVGSNQCGFRLEPSVLLPQDTQGSSQGEVSANWSYKLDASSLWIPFTPYSDVFTAAVFTTLTVRVQLLTTSQNASLLTPLIDSDDLNLTLFGREMLGIYASRVITVDDPYNTVRMNAKVRQTAPSAFVDWYFSDQTPAPGSIPNWSAGATYTAGDVVSSGGNPWLALASSGPTVTTPAEGSTWTRARVDSGLLWRLVPTVGQTVSTINSEERFGYQQIERVLELPPSFTRNQAQVMFYTGITSPTDAVDPPEVTDLIVLLSE